MKDKIDLLKDIGFVFEKIKIHHNNEIHRYCYYPKYSDDMYYTLTIYYQSMAEHYGIDYSVTTQLQVCREYINDNHSDLILMCDGNDKNDFFIKKYNKASKLEIRNKKILSIIQ